MSSLMGRALSPSRNVSYGLCPKQAGVGHQPRPGGVLLRSLIGRGLDPDGIILVVADGAGGIATAVAEAFPDAAFGRCWAHRVRNLLDAIPLAERKSALRGLRTIYRASTKRAAVTAYWRFAKAWGGRRLRLVASLERGLDSVLPVFDLPAALRVSLHTINLIEHAFREIPRRLRPIGAMSDRRSADRSFYRPGDPSQRTTGETPACRPSHYSGAAIRRRRPAGSRRPGGRPRSSGARGRAARGPGVVSSCPWRLVSAG